MNDDAGLEKKILSLIAGAARAGPGRKVSITGNMRLQRDLGIDSIGVLGLLARFEELFGVRLTEEDLTANVGQIRTVDDAISFGRRKISKSLDAP